jgi:uncharacterized protein
VTSPIGILAHISTVALVVYLAYESAVSLKKYRRTQQGIAEGDPDARSRLYREILRFEFISAALAVVALQFDRARLTPANLQVGDSAFGRWWSSMWQHMGSAFIVGLSIGAVFSLVVATVAIRRARGRPAAPRANPSSLKKLVPDFSALIPTTPRERVLFVAVALSAGICEELVYRAWLLDALHGVVGLTGGVLVVAGAVAFGLGHYYQGVAGMLVTSLLGFMLCGLYVATGSLVVPIIVHALIDLRVAVLPTGAPRGAPTSSAG